MFAVFCLKNRVFEPILSRLMCDSSNFGVFSEISPRLLDLEENMTLVLENDKF